MRAFFWQIAADWFAQIQYPLTMFAILCVCSLVALMAVLR